MAAPVLPKEYPFLDPREDRGFCVFHDEFENDPRVLFHGTAYANLAPIVADGFKIPDPTGQNGLPSVSFAKRSSGALMWVENRRKAMPGAYCIIAVRYESLDREGIANNVDDIHDHKLDPQPKVIGYCVVPDVINYVWN
jgi:hypothetical protein